MSKYHLPFRGSGQIGHRSIEGGVNVTPESAGWRHASLWVVDLAPGGTCFATTEDDEVIVVPLHGPGVLTCESETVALTGRASVFDGPTDVGYVGRGSAFDLSSTAGGRFAIGGARAHSDFPFRHVPADAVSVEVRGAGMCRREIRNIAMADTFAADSLMMCEVITPGGNWSSYPAHKHDEASATETELEEIYYFEFAPAPTGAPGFGYHRVYGTPQRPIEVLAEVRDQDVVLVPHGYHGPSIAAPGHDMYYLNVMAGPVRAWRITDDPTQAWIRKTWEDS